MVGPKLPILILLLILSPKQSYTYTVRCLSDDGEKFISGFNPKGSKTEYYSVPKIKGVEVKNCSVHKGNDVVPKI